MNIKIFALCCFSPLFMSIISTNAFASVVFVENNSYSSHVGKLQNMATGSVDNYSFSNNYSGQIPNGQVHDYISEFVATPASTINLFDFTSLSFLTFDAPYQYRFSAVADVSH